MKQRNQEMLGFHQQQLNSYTAESETNIKQISDSTNGDAAEKTHED